MFSSFWFLSTGMNGNENDLWDGMSEMGKTMKTFMKSGNSNDDYHCRPAE